MIDMQRLAKVDASGSGQGDMLYMRGISQDNPIDVIIGEAVAKARRRHGMSPSQTANFLNVTEDEYCSMEQGSARFTAAHLFRLSHRFDVGLGFFLSKYFQETRVPRDRRAGRT